MLSSTKEQTEGMIQKMKSSFMEIFGGANETPTLEADGAGEKITGKDHE